MVLAFNLYAALQKKAVVQAPSPIKMVSLPQRSCYEAIDHDLKNFYLGSFEPKAAFLHKKRTVHKERFL